MFTTALYFNYLLLFFRFYNTLWNENTLHNKISNGRKFISENKRDWRIEWMIDDER